MVDASLNDMFDVNVGTLLSEKLDHSLAARLDPLLGGHYPLPVVVDNDLNVLGVHETYRPRSPERNIAVVAVFDDGVGSALIVDGRVYRGGNGMAGEIGHLYVPMDLSGLPEPPALENETSDRWAQVTSVRHGDSRTSVIARQVRVPLRESWIISTATHRPKAFVDNWVSRLRTLRRSQPRR